MTPFTLGALAGLPSCMLSVPANAQATDDTNSETKVKLSSQLGHAIEFSGYFQINKWLDQGIEYIISTEESVAFAMLHTEDERSQFFVDFWLRRDPTPTPRQMNIAMNTIAASPTPMSILPPEYPGWRTDRGMVYVKFGLGMKS